MFKIFRNMFSVAAALLVAQSASASLLYLSDGDGYRVMAVDTTTGAVAKSWTANPVQRAFPIAVDGDIRTTGYAAGETGGKYSLTGTYLGTHYELPNLGTTFSDGTTDGKFNYGIAWSEGGVYRFDRNWANPVLMFSTGISSGGIAYDSRNNTLWTSCDRCGGLSNYSMTGTLLGTISTLAQSSYLDWDLAYDASDDSLWVSQAFSSTFFHYSAAGGYLGSLSIAAHASSFFSGEFDLAAAPAPVNGNAVPEPSALALVGLGLLAMLGLTRKRPALA